MRLRLVLAAAALVIAQAPAPSTAPSAPPAPSEPAWLPRGEAELEVLDKVSARVSPLSVKVGQSGKFGPLTIGVRGCDVRPADVAADSAAFLDVTDTTPGAPEFHAWIIASVPAVSAMQHPVYDVRLLTCR